MGKLIVIDGLDGSGKATQARLLFNRLRNINNNVIKISFPNYKDDSSILVKMYLSGKLGFKANNVNPYAASSFYAVDRYISYNKYWKEKYLQGYDIICDRYVTSNIIHQMAKLEKSKWKNFINWVEDYEYNKLKLPKPNKIIYLDLDLHLCLQLIEARCNNNKIKKDIHEKDIFYLKKCKEAAQYISTLQQWSVVNCCDNNGNLYSRELLHTKIFEKIN